MARGGGEKRKRGERSYPGDSKDENSRPSPHRPETLNLGQRGIQQQQSPIHGRDAFEQSRGARRRGSRGGRGGGSQRSPLDSPSAVAPLPRLIDTPSKAMSQTPAQALPAPAFKQNSAAPTRPATNTTATSLAEKIQPNPTPYDYDSIPDDKVKMWKESGRQEVVSNAAAACNAADYCLLGVIFQELIRSCLDGRLSPTEAGSTVKEILDRTAAGAPSSDDMTDELGFSPSSLFLDNLSIVTEIVGTTPSLNAFILATEIPPSQMRRELDSTLLESLGLIRNTFVRVGIRQQTNLLYRQSNYNLLREETEGYSKLVTELFTTSNNEPPTSETVEETFERVKGMIGAFDLDVGRVLDITLDVFAAVLVKQYRFFVKYLRASSWWPQESAFKGVCIQPPVGSLPWWALPGSSSRPMGEDEKAELHALRTERDEAFWKRCRDIGSLAFFELGGRRTDEAALETASHNAGASEPSQHDDDCKWIEITRTLPPLGNKVAAQVLGFKLRFYSSDARDPADVLPVNLIYLAALLIKVGFISLRDLYPHIWPADTSMDTIREEKMKEKAEKEKLNRPGGAATNALLSAAPLTDDSPEGQAREAARIREVEVARRQLSKTDPTTDRSTSSVQPEEKLEELPEPSEQKVQLLKSLLCIGALPEALYMLGRFPWLPDAFPDLPEYIHRILHHCLSKVYEPFRPLREQDGLQEQQKVPNPESTNTAKGQVRLKDAPARKTMRWAQLDKDDTNEAIDYRFYWDEWADNLPVCQTVDDVFTLCSTLLNYSGVKIGQDTTLLLKLSRIGSHSLATDTSDSNMARWVDLSKRLLVPALSLSKSNPGAVNEVFELIKNFSTATRYGIYAEWYSGQTSRLPDIKAAFEQTKAETRDVLKRISKTTIKPMARALAKVAYASPGVVFSVAISQLESYENLVDTFVECARYFTYLAYDVLTWSVMSALGGQGRNRVQADGLLTSRWLAALSVFAGKVFKRYSVMNPLPIVQYVADQLRQGNVTDLIVLEDITKSMAGIISDSTFNESQVQAMAGGDLLQAQTLLQLLDRRHESKNTARRLIKPLTDSRLAGQVLISLAQERQMCVFKVEEQDAHPKLLGNVFDQLSRILGQYIELMRSNLSPQDFDFFVPSVNRLISEFGLEPSVAFWISRPSINAAMAEHDGIHGKRNIDAKKSPTKENAEHSPTGDKEMTDQTSAVQEAEVAAEDKMDTSSMPAAEDQVDQSNGSEMKVSTANSITTGNSAPKRESTTEPWHPVLQHIIDVIQPALPPETWSVLNPSFYVTFWQLSLRDIYMSLQSYDDEINRQKKKTIAINSDRSDISVLGTQKKEKEKKTLADLQDRLREESKERVQIFSQGRTRLMKEKEQWFTGAWGKFNQLNMALIEHCFFPRIVMSPVDAYYCFRMLKYLHSSGTPNFRTMGVYDQFFNEKNLASMIFLCTAKEAENFGRFLNEILKDLSRWHADKALFEKEAFGVKRDLPGFSKKMTKDKEVATFWDYEDFRRILLKWHRSLNSALKTCYSSGEYMHIRNGINILNNIHHYFPAVNWMGSNQMHAMSELKEKESRGDLKIAAASLLGSLKKREREWMLPQAFSLVGNPILHDIELFFDFMQNEGGVSNGTRATSARPGTPQPGSDALKALNPKAPDFQPSPRTNVNGIAKAGKPGPGKLEAEDGEIEDIQMTDAPAKEKSNADKAEPAKSEIGTPAGTALESEGLTQPSKAPTTAAKDMRAHIQDPASTKSDAPASKSTTQPTSDVASTSDEPTSRPLPPPSVPARPEVDRNLFSSSANGRAQHNLPSRPDAPQQRRGDHRIPSRPTDRLPLDHPRDLRFPERGSTDGARDLSRERGPERLPTVPQSRGLDRDGERPHSIMRDHKDLRYGGDSTITPRSGPNDRFGGPPSREAEQYQRDERAGRLPNGRTPPEQDQMRREFSSGRPTGNDNAMLPPRSTMHQHPDRASITHPPGNSERLSDTSRQSHYPGAGRSSRGQSPARIDDRNAPHDGRRNDRSQLEVRRSTEERSNSSRYEESHAPTGPRTDRGPGAGPSHTNERFRESMRQAAPLTTPFDPNHGRLKPESGHGIRQSESYGRLNAGSDIPSGPRLANGNHPPPARGGRNVSAPQPSTNTQQPPVSQNPISPSVAADRQTRSGALLRGPSRNGPSSPPPPPATPQTPAAQTPETAGIHPDRLKAIQGTGPASGSTAAPNRPEPVRGPRPAPPPVSVPPNVPRGPNNQLASPIGPSPTSRGPPTGPSFSNDRNRGDKRFSQLQNVLQQNTPGAPDRAGQGASIRGRGGRANNVGTHSPSTTGPPTANMPRPEAFHRGDLVPGRGSGSAAASQPDEEGGHGRSGRRGQAWEEGRDADRRSVRHRSRSPGKDRASDPSMRVRDDERGAIREDPRDRFRNEGIPTNMRGTGAGPDRDMRGPPPIERELRGGPPPRRPGRDEPPTYRERGEMDHRGNQDWGGDRKGMADRREDERDRREGGGSMRKRGRGGDEAMGDSKRARR